MARTYVLGPNAARELKRLIRGTGGTSRRVVSSGALVFDREYADPFTVTWAASLNDGDGAWIIWLPSDALLQVENFTIDVSDGLDDAGGEYPAGWYQLGDVLDADGGGDLYLHVTIGEELSAEFRGELEPGGEGSLDILICKASVDAETGIRTVSQLVKSAIVLTAGSGGSGVGAYHGDERSVSLVSVPGGDDVGPVLGNYFHLAGFGKFVNPQSGLQIGDYFPAGDEEIEVDGEATDYAIVCREGEGNTGNFIAYKKLRVVSSGGSSPFAYRKITQQQTAVGLGEDEGEGGEDEGPVVVTIHKVVNCAFYWNGEQRILPDFDVSNLMQGGTLYLRGVQQAPSENGGEPDWDWSMGPDTLPAPTGGRARNYKLYDFADGKVQMDWRTTFLALEDGGVRMLNGMTGAVRVVGGSKIEVTSSGQQIRVSYNDTAEPDEGGVKDPNTNCDNHPGGGDGVPAGGYPLGGGGYVPSGGGGIWGDGVSALPEGVSYGAGCPDCSL